MLPISRWKALAAVLTAAVLCLAIVPDFLSRSTLDRLPTWAQHRIALPLTFHGGSRVVLAVDTNAVRKMELETVRDDVRRVMREARIPLASAPVLRDNGVEVRVRDTADVALAVGRLQQFYFPDLPVAPAVARPAVPVASGLQVVSQAGSPRSPVPPVTIVADGTLIRVAPTEALIAERVEQGRDRAVFVTQRRIADIGLAGQVEPHGLDRVALEIPGLYEPRRPFEIMY